MNSDTTSWFAVFSPLTGTLSSSGPSMRKLSYSWLLKMVKLASDTCCNQSSNTSSRSTLRWLSLLAHSWSSCMTKKCLKMTSLYSGSTGNSSLTNPAPCMTEDPKDSSGKTSLSSSNGSRKYSFFESHVPCINMNESTKADYEAQR